MNNLKNDFCFLEAEENTKRNNHTGAGVLTIINASAKGNGMRIVFSKQLEEDLSLTDKIQLAVSKDGKSLYVGAELDASQTCYSLRRLKKDESKSKLVLYNSAVIKEITEKLNLSFEDRVGITFYRIEYLEIENSRVAKVWEKGCDKVVSKNEL